MSIARKISQCCLRLAFDQVWVLKFSAGGRSRANRVWRAWPTSRDRALLDRRAALIHEGAVRGQGCFNTPRCSACDIIGDMRKRGLTLVSVHEPDLLQDDPTRTLLRQMMGATAQYEKAMLVLKLRGARNRMKAAGGQGKEHGLSDQMRAKLKRWRACWRLLLTTRTTGLRLPRNWMQKAARRPWRNVAPIRGQPH